MTTPPTDPNWRDLADELQAMTDLRSEEGTVKIEHKGGSAKKLQAIYSLARAAGDVGKHAISGLLDGNEWASIPAVRLTLELGITAQWITVTDSGAEALISEFGRQRKNLQNDASKTAMFAGQQVVVTGAGISEITGVDLAGRHFQARCQSLTKGDDLYLLYRLASSYAHATADVADLYLDLDPGPLGAAFRWEPKARTDEQAKLQAAQAAQPLPQP